MQGTGGISGKQGYAVKGSRYKLRLCVGKIFARITERKQNCDGLNSGQSVNGLVNIGKPFGSA